MIKINFGKNKLPLQEIAEWHWQQLNPKSATGEFDKHSLIIKFKEAIEQYGKNGQTAEALFCRTFLANDNDLLRRVITTPIGSFQKIIDEVQGLLSRLNLLPLNSSISGKGSIGYDMLHDIMNYSGWRGNGGGIRLYEQLNLEVCPYCNLGLIHQDELRGFLVAHYDHFYDKSRYPYLCLSFYNLLPVCQSCNTPYKGTKQFTIDTHLHPYRDNYNSAVTFSSDYVNDLVPHSTNISYTDGNSVKAKKFNDDLGIPVRYNLNNVKRYGRLIFILSQEYQGTQKDELCQKLNLTLNEVEKHICSIKDIPYDESDILNLQYGKLKRDLSIKNKIITT
jgi:hypothetical protein